MFYTYQDFLEAKTQGDLIGFIQRAINRHRSSPECKMAMMADDYDRQQNTTINEFARRMYTAAGAEVVDFTASNNRIASNFFRRLVTQRCTYSLGNGLSFDENSDEIKDALGKKFDTDLYNCAYAAEKHGVSFGFWNMNRLYVYPFTQFVPLYDEDNGALRAGIRYWSIDWQNKPVTAYLYEEDGYTKYGTKAGSKGLNLEEKQPKRAYKQKVVRTQADGEEVVGEENYGSLPIVPLWANRNKQSALVGMRAAIDSYDLIQSGFANDLQDCAQVYWIINGAFGMDSADIQKFLDRIKLNHAAVADMDNTEIKPYAQDLPYNARKAYLDHIRAEIYEDFGAVDVHAVQAGATNDHIAAAYQAQDEEADDFEYQIIEFVQQILRIAGLPETVPQFNRNRIANEQQKTQMVMMAANYLDDRTILEKLPFITSDEIDGILEARGVEEAGRFEDEEEEEAEPLDELEDDTEMEDELDALEKELDGLGGEE